MHPREFLDTFVYPSIEAWGRDQLNAALAVSAISQVDILGEVAHEYITLGLSDPVYAIAKPNIPKTAAKFKEELSKTHLVIGIIRDIHDAHKHGKLSRPTAINVSDRQAPNILVSTSYPSGEPVHAQLAIQLEDGYNRPIRSIISAALQVWQLVLTGYGICDVDIFAVQRLPLLDADCFEQ
jgi:hypothetical protein